MKIGSFFTFLGRIRLKAIVVLVILALLVTGISLSSRFQATEESSLDDAFVNGGNLLVHIDDGGLPGLGRLKIVGDCREIDTGGAGAKTIDTVTRGGWALCQLKIGRASGRERMW